MRTYYTMHEKQTVEFVRSQVRLYLVTLLQEKNTLWGLNFANDCISLNENPLVIAFSEIFRW